MPALTCVLPLIALAYGFLKADTIDIDDDVPQAQTASGPFLVTLFVSREGINAGSAELAVLVRDSKSNQPMPNVELQITASTIGIEEKPERIFASGEPTTNRLLYGARINFPSRGMWDVSVAARSEDNQEVTLTTRIEVK